MAYARRHQLLWTLLRPLARLVLKLKFNYSCGSHTPQGPFLLVCNHVTDWDPILVGAAFTPQMYFVTSEHLLRQGLVSRFIHWAQAPIARQKGGSAAGTVKAMLRTLRDGRNVGLFPEGNRCWDGVTGDFPASTAKLVKSSGASLVTFRLIGGYLANPRWAGTASRRGRMRGELVGVYSPEQLRTMSSGEIRDLIARDLREDAYERQSTENVAFRGKRLAEHLETLLFLCPKCGAMHRLRSRGDRFFCEACGMSTRYTTAGLFEGGELPFDNVRSWNVWQTQKLQELCDAAGDGPIFTDSGFDLYRVHTARSLERVGSGELRLYRDRLELPGGISLPLGSIAGMSLRGPSDLFIGTADASSFEVHSDDVRCTLKYLLACRYLGSPFEYAV